MEKLVLIDGNSIANRAFYALPLLSTDQGTYTNAVYGFTTMLLKILEEEKPTHILVAFDAGKVTFRHADFKEYKGKRQKTPPELSEQFPLIRELLDAFDIKRYELEGYEADDIIGTITKQADTAGIQTKVFTGDKDMLQLISDHVQIALTRKGISEVEAYDEQALFEKYQLKPDQIKDLKGLMGDQSDNIPGVPGVGEKTALKLLHQYATVEEVYQHLEEISGKKLVENLSNHKEDALLSKELATILREAPLEVNLEDAAFTGYTPEKVAPFFKALAFESLLSRIGADDIVEEQQELEAINYTVITENEDKLLDQALQGPVALYLELDEGNFHTADILGLALANQSGHYILPPNMLTQAKVQAFLADETQEKWVYHAKLCKATLAWNGITLNGIHFDSYLASYLLNPADSGHEMESIAKQFGKLELPSSEQIYGKGAKRKLPEEVVLYEYLARKAHALMLTKDTIAAELEKVDMQSLFEDLELPLSTVLATMEVEGIRVDRHTLVEMEKNIKQRLEELTKGIYELAGTEFNINSPKQLGEILFDKLGLPVIKKTKTGYSTNAEVLEKLEPQHEIVRLILEFRQLGKLQSTYIDGLLQVIDPKTEKIHSTFQQTVTTTGRLSSIDPNLQNIPIRLEEGRKIRKAFVPSKENAYIMAADYSQIELRILAHISGDEGMIKAFQENKDIHTQTAVDVFQVDETEVDSLMRRTAKAVNFGIVYGISDYGLSQNLNITRKEAATFIEKYFATFPGVKQFMEDIVKQAKKDGYVTTLLNRRRYLPEINSRNFNLRSFAERTAMNTPIQGSAADIIKLAMIDMHQQIIEKKLETKLLLQVHDELVFEVPEHELNTMQELIKQVMENAMVLKVPLQVDINYGKSWYDAK